jgi:hypothetical protein
MLISNLVSLNDSKSVAAKQIPIEVNSMSDNDLSSKIDDLHGMFGNALDKIAEWNKLVPDMQRARDQLSWMSDSIHKAPNIVNSTTDETLLDSLSKSRVAVSGMLSLLYPPNNFGPIVTTSASVNTAVYTQFVHNVSQQLSSIPEVVDWARKTTIAGEALRQNQDRSNEVHRRLNLLSPKLGKLHEQAQQATLSSVAEVAGAVEAASTQRSLLDEFKGVLISRCRAGNGTKYARISDNLALDSDFTRETVTSGQHAYDSLHWDLSQISHSKTIVTGEQMQRLLYDLEDHIWIITSALDPDKLGVSFTNPT